MATRERRLAEFDGEGEPPPDQPVQVLCEDHSGTYQLPFACRFVDGEWRNNRTGGVVEATVVGWRLPRSGNVRLAPCADAFARTQRCMAVRIALCQNATEPRVFTFGTRPERIAPESLVGPYSDVHGYMSASIRGGAPHPAPQHRPQPAADDKG